MSRFLFAWELGGGLGHVGPFVPVACALRAAGHHAALALRDLRTLGAIDPGPETPVFQAPVCIHTYEGLAEPPLNYAEILMRFGYADAGMLSGLVRGWRELMQSMRADIVVVDHAPTALLAARTLGLRSMVLGGAFYLPPLLAPTPNMRPWLEVPAGRLQESERSVLDTVNTALAGFGSPALAHLHQLFAVDDIVIVNFRELDQYGRRPAADLERITYCGPIAAAGIGAVSPPWPAAKQTGPGIFAYLKPGYAHLGPMLAALAASGRPCVIYGLGSGSPAAPAKATNLAFSALPIDIGQAGRECAIAICHAGTTCAVLLQAGRPQLLLPMHLEQFLEGMRVAEAGAGLVINPEEKSPDIAGALARLLTESHFAGRAAEFAARYRDYSTDRMVDSVVARLAKLAAGGRRDTRELAS